MNNNKNNHCFICNSETHDISEWPTCTSCHKELDINSNKFLIKNIENKISFLVAELKMLKQKMPEDSYQKFINNDNLKLLLELLN